MNNTKYILSIPSSVQVDRRLQEKLSEIAIKKGITQASLIKMILVESIDRISLIDQIAANTEAITDILFFLKNVHKSTGYGKFIEETLKRYKEES